MAERGGAGQPHKHVREVELCGREGGAVRPHKHVREVELCGREGGVGRSHKNVRGSNCVIEWKVQGGLTNTLSLKVREVELCVTEMRSLEIGKLSCASLKMTTLFHLRMTELNCD